MKYFQRYLYLFSCFFCLAAAAQDQKLISGNFTGYSFPRLVNEIERQTPYHIFYDSAETDSVVINIQADDLTLQELLDKAFKNTDIHYALGSGNQVFVTKHYTIQTSLVKNFFTPGNANGDSSSQTAFFADDALTPKTNLKISADNKLFEIGTKTGKTTLGKSAVAGYVRDVRTGEAIMGASISVDTLSIIKTTDQFGYYNLMLPKGRHILHISSVGMKDARRQVIVYSDGKLNIEMDVFVASLKAVYVSADKTSNTRSVQMGVSKLNIQTIKQVPVVFGEADVLKVLLTLPGVTSVGEGSNGFNVRGGAADQNLILYNDATVYNPSHLFGFFSAFDPDLVKSVELYKSAIPEKYGGRLSSVLDVDVKDGNNKKWTGSAGISPLTSKFSIEGPLQKDKTSVIAGFRTTYSDWLLKQIPSSSYSNSTANFYDASIHLSHIINAKNTIYLMGYLSSDKFNLDGDTTYAYANRNANLKWKHNFSNSSFAVFTTGLDHYQYEVTSTKVPINAYQLKFNINQIYLRADFTYSPNNKHTISYGLNSVYYQLQPGTLTPVGSASLVQTNTVQQEQALESAVFLGDQFTVSEKLSLNAGARFTVYNFLGPSHVYQYVPGIPRESYTITDTLNYSAGKFIKTYALPEWRFSARYSLTNTASLKFSFNTMTQYIHVISNTTNISPTDIWKLSDPDIKPQQGQQVSLGLYKNFRSNSIETSVEVYYKKMQNYLDYKSGANLVLNPHLATDVFETEGKAYGIEFLLKKNTGKLNGWISYTYSRTMLKQNDPLAGQLVNNGQYYPASFDKPNMVNFIGNYRFSHRYSLSLNIIYSTGRPITLPLAIVQSGGASTLYYSERNAYRIPDYFRTDISVNMEGNHKTNKLTHNSWSAGIYNVTGRQNAYSVYFVQENGKVKGYQLSIFGTLIPFVTYNIKF
jgi:TonB dependent receptor/CarboxypepD_reg-like domain/TonB-dependent Receptor Plug Domain